MNIYINLVLQFFICQSYDGTCYVMGSVHPSVQCPLISRSHNFLQPSWISMKHYTVIPWDIFNICVVFQGIWSKVKVTLEKNFNQNLNIAENFIQPSWISMKSDTVIPRGAPNMCHSAHFQSEGQKSEVKVTLGKKSTKTWILYRNSYDLHGFQWIIMHWFPEGLQHVSNKFKWAYYTLWLSTTYHWGRSLYSIMLQ